MTGDLAASPRLRNAVLSSISLAGGVALAAIPAATVSISARLFTSSEQGVVAVAVMIATFFGQLTFSIVVESRLSSAATERRVVFPLWLAAASIVTSVVLAFNYANPYVLCVGLPVLIASLEVGRGVSVAERLDIREMWSSIAVGAGALLGVIAGFTHQQWAFIPLLVGITVATCIRCYPVSHHASAPSRSVMGWVVADTAITGVIYPLLNAMILAFIGPADSVLFTAIATVSGLLAIPLNFMRLRLLKEHSTLDIVLSASAVFAAIVALVVLELLGVFGFIFGSAWSGSATLVPLLLACGWRAASLATTIPFAALRRVGAVRLLAGLRAAVSILTFALAAIGLSLQNLSAVFLGLLVAELASALIYELARRWHTSRHRAMGELS